MKHLLLVLCWFPLSASCVAQQASARFGALQWTFHATGKIFSSPVLCGNLVLVGSEDDTLYALDAATGIPRWTFRPGGPIDGTPAVVGGTAFFNSYDGNLYAVDASSGRLTWKFRTRGEKRVGAMGLWTMKPATRYMEDPFDFFESSAVVDSSAGLLYFGSGDGNLYALGVSDGSLRWRFQTGGIVHTTPALSGHSVYFGSWDRNLYALDARTGRQKWKFMTGADTTFHLLEGIQASPLVYGRDVFFGARDGNFYCLDTTTGRLVWKYDAAHSWILSTAAASDHIIYTGTSDTYLLLALDSGTGKEKFRVAASGYVYTPPVVNGQTVYFGDF
ncbi:MAG TPA: PQQ-binding-like beta-propeller repeat protein, partial [Puia sp.]|nr:PQQ-binding-like beta-propeller repeat protein [Puia sp.]